MKLNVSGVELRAFRLLIFFAGALLLAGCGKGIDARLSVNDERSYRESLNKAWEVMTDEQKNAFNWAVSNLSLDEFFRRYPKSTPRDVISSEADAYIKLKTEALAKVTAEYARDAAKLAEQERVTKNTLDELAKITVRSAVMGKDSFFRSVRLTFVTDNGSRYGVSNADWDAWLFLDNNEKPSASCRISAYYKTDGGLDSGKSKSYSTSRLGFDCRDWDTIEIQRAKLRNVVMELVPESVQDFGERKILPQFEVSRASYETAMKDLKAEIQAAENYKAVLK